MEIGGPVGRQMPCGIDTGAKQRRERRLMRECPVARDTVDGARAGIVGQHRHRGNRAPRVERELEGRRRRHDPPAIELTYEDVVAPLGGLKCTAPGLAIVERVLDSVPDLHPRHRQRAVGGDPVGVAGPGVIAEFDDRGVDHPGQDRVDDLLARIDVGIIWIRADEVPAVDVRARIDVGRPLEIQAGRQILTVDTRGDPDHRVSLSIVGHVVGGDRDRRGGPQNRVGDRSRRAAVI